MGVAVKKLPIDTGYAWIIVFAGTCLFAVNVGGLKCQGIVLVELVHRYKDVYTPSSLLWVFSVYTMVAAISGPPVSILIIKMGHRAVAMLGVVALCLSNISLAYASSLPAMVVLYSIIGGFGNRMIISTCQLMSQSYFKEKRAMAVGIITGGGGVGTLVIPYIIRPLFDHLDFSSALLMYAGFNLQFVCVAALLRPISYYQELPFPDAFPDTGATHKTTPITYKKGLLTKSQPNLEIGCLEHMLQDEGKPRNRSCSLDTHQLLANECQIQFGVDGAKGPSQLTHRLGVGRQSPLPVSTEDPAESLAMVEKDNTKLHTVSEAADWAHKVQSSNCVVLTIPGFITFCTCIMLYMFGQGIVYQCVPSLAEECGISRSMVAIVIMITGGLEVPCRIANGLLVDRHIITATNQFTLSLFIAGTLTLLCAIISGLPGIILVLLGMASAGSSFYTLMPFVLAEIVGVENVTLAIGIQTFCQSVGVITSTSIAGYLYDTYNTWRVVYFFISGMMLLSCGVIFPYCLVIWWNQRVSRKGTSSDTDTAAGRQSVKDRQLNSS